MIRDHGEGYNKTSIPSVDRDVGNRCDGCGGDQGGPSSGEGEEGCSCASNETSLWRTVRWIAAANTVGGSEFEGLREGWSEGRKARGGLC